MKYKGLFNEDIVADATKLVSQEVETKPLTFSNVDDVMKFAETAPNHLDVFPLSIKEKAKINSYKLPVESAKYRDMTDKSTDQFHQHHIYARSLFPENQGKNDVLIILSKDDHDKLHESLKNGLQSYEDAIINLIGEQERGKLKIRETYEKRIENLLM